MRMVDWRITGAYRSPVSAAIRAAALLFVSRFPHLESAATLEARRRASAFHASLDDHHRRRR